MVSKHQLMFIKESSLDIRGLESEYTILVSIPESKEQYTRVPHPPLLGIEQ